MRGGERESERASERASEGEDQRRGRARIAPTFAHRNRHLSSYVWVWGTVREREGKTDARGKKGRKAGRRKNRLASANGNLAASPPDQRDPIPNSTQSENWEAGGLASHGLSLIGARAREVIFFSFDQCAGRRGPALVSIPAADLASGVSFRSIPGRPNHPRSLPSFSGKTTFAFSGHARARHRTEWRRGGRHRLLIPSAGPPADRDRDHGRAPAAAVNPPPPRGFLLDSVKVCLDRPRPQTATAMMISDHSNSNVTIAY